MLKNTERRLKQLVAKHGTPLGVIRKSVLLANVQKFKRLLPRVTPYYAIKANPHPDIIRAFVSVGLGFDAASAQEMDLALSLGAKPGKIIFAHTIKRPEYLKHAMAQDVTAMTFDSEYELSKIARHARGARVLVRIKVPNVGSIVELSLKFGADPADAIPLLRKAKSLGLEPIGVSFHVGSQCTHVENFVEAFEMGAIILSDAKLKGMPLRILDIGGGFPIRHFDAEKQDPFEAMAPTLNREMDRLFDQTVEIMAEPGRSLVGPAVTLVMRVIGKAIRENKHWYYLDDGVYGALSGIVFDHCKYQYKVMKRGELQISTLAGPTCDSFDIISRSEELPELDVGDIVYVDNIGAYSTASATHFNGLPPAKCIFTE
ncbi:MAG: type III PLP-dependent enzyme [Planctomycetes bacterium]|nr:type III PLP-dependent enzyme [Planctomycetota bacterium]MBM4078247.1 type III PLP-dependent enzyme [Planctomycetota bacterium]MBM4083290.1 type III PLP-dependent enzyme [Planctomycetota bacterium]